MPAGVGGWGSITIPAHACLARTATRRPYLSGLAGRLHAHTPVHIAWFALLISPGERALRVFEGVGLNGQPIPPCLCSPPVQRRRKTRHATKNSACDIERRTRDVDMAGDDSAYLLFSPACYTPFWTSPGSLPCALREPWFSPPTCCRCARLRTYYWTAVGIRGMGAGACRRSDRETIAEQQRISDTSSPREALPSGALAVGRAWWRVICAR